MMRWLHRLYLQWCLTSNETYIRCLHASGWSDDHTQALRYECQALRVKLWQ